MSHHRFLPAVLMLLIVPPGCEGQTVNVDPPKRTGDATESIPQNSWPCWMGPDHSGIAQSYEGSLEWPGELPHAWSREIGIGFSSVAVSNGRLFSMGHVDGNEFVYCLNAQTGELVWQHSYESALVDNLYEGGPGSTPTVHQGRVYTLGKEGQLFCFDEVGGKILWEKNLQEDLGVPMPEWGFNSSGYVFGNAIIFEAGRVVAYDQRSGNKLWQTPEHQAGYGSATRLELAGRSYLVTLDCDAVRVIDAADGRQVAEAAWKSPFRTNSTTPIVRGDTVFISTGYQVGCGLFRFTGSDLELMYDNRDMRNHFNNSILYEGKLYGFDGNSNLGRVVHLVCMDHATGRVCWRKRGFGCGSLMVAGGKLLILADDGTLALADAEPTEYREITRTKLLEGRCWTVPVLLGTTVFARNATGRLVAGKLPASK